MEEAESLHARELPRVTLSMKKLLFVCLLAGATVLLVLAQTRRVGPGRVTGGGSQAPVYAPYEMLSVYPQEAGNGEFDQVDPQQLQSLSAEGWQLVSVAPYAYRNEGHATSNLATSPPPPLVTQVYLAYFFQRSRLMR
jgi:hypothetical protein